MTTPLHTHYDFCEFPIFIWQMFCFYNDLLIVFLLLVLISLPASYTNLSLLAIFSPEFSLCDTSKFCAGDQEKKT
jgi:hypothetical protein